MSPLRPGFYVVMFLGCPPLVERHEVFANVDALPEAAARTLLADLEACIGTGGIGTANLTLLGVELRELP